VPPYTIALTGCGILLAWGLWRRQITWESVREISWPIFPFILGLFVVVRGVENIGLAADAARGLTLVGHSSWALVPATALGAALGANIINNIPMALLAISALHHGASPAAQYGALLGCDLGPNLAVSGSLATMLVITSARRQGQDISTRDFFLLGLRVTPLVLLVSGLSLWVMLNLFR
jgi:arsenical pump membrane protein